MPIPTLHALIVTEDPELGTTLVDMLATCGVEAETSDGARAASGLLHQPPDFVALDLDIVDHDPLSLLFNLQDRIHAGQVLLLASTNSLSQVANATSLGFPWYQKKPLGLVDIKIAVRRARAASGFGKSAVSQMLGSSPGIQAALKLARQMAQRSGHLTVSGEAGVGKRLLARMIHDNSRRTHQPVRHFSCAGLSHSVIDQELFGGDAADGVDASPDGLLGQCHRGTLIIDEIFHLPLPAQERLLRCLAHAGIESGGGHSSAEALDVRIIATSTDRLEDCVTTGSFANELFSRLSGVHVELLPLRERKSDIPMLADHFVRRAGQLSGRTFKGIAQDGLERLMRYQWPGNVRELQDMITHAVGSSHGPWLTTDDLPSLPETNGAHSSIVLGSTIHEIEREAILATLDAAGGSTGRAAEILNISVRKIQYKLKEYRLESASTLRSETVRSLPSKPSQHSPIPKKKTVFVADRESRD